MRVVGARGDLAAVLGGPTTWTASTALIYQYATTRADRLIATALDAEVRRATKRKNRQTRPRSERSDSAPNGNHDEAISAPGSLAHRSSAQTE